MHSFCAEGWHAEQGLLVWCACAPVRRVVCDSCKREGLPKALRLRGSLGAQRLCQHPTAELCWGAVPGKWPHAPRHGGHCGLIFGCMTPNISLKAACLATHQNTVKKTIMRQGFLVA